MNDAAVGVARGGVLTTYDTEYTVEAHKKEVGAYVDWYTVAAGKQDWGDFGWRIGLAYQMYIEGKVIQAMASVITNNTSGNNRDGIAGYMANGFSDANWVATARNVELANGGSKVYALGTKLALQEVLPDNSIKTQFRFDETSALVRTGYLPSYKEVPLVELGQALIPNTINGPSAPSTVVSDKIIYMLPMGMNRPIHVVTEGNSLTVTKNPLEHADHTYTMHVNMFIGVGTVIGSKFGAIILP